MFLSTRTAAWHRLRALTPPRWLRPLVLVLCWIPAVLAAAGVVADLFFGTRFFGANPIKQVEHFTGEWTLRFLIFTLAVTPARRLLGWNWLSRYRRTFGLFAFLHGCVHLVIYAALDVELTWSDLVADVLERPYITIGMVALLLMAPLALTSTRQWVKRLGKRWIALHRLIYAIVILGVIHFGMAVKKDIEDPLIFAAIIGALLSYRVAWSWHTRRARPAELGAARRAA